MDGNFSIHASDSVSNRQHEHRKAICQAWGISAGQRILELGCGQGDMTLALAEAVGSSGFVLGLDSADPNYGSPKTLGECTQEIAKSFLGGRIEFQLDTDFLVSSSQLKSKDFDAVVLAHSAWYFASEDQLRETFVATKTVAPVLHLAEWNLEPKSLQQLPHLLAIFIQHGIGQHSLEEANARTPLSLGRFKDLLQEAGWQIERQGELDTTGLQDADWEIGISEDFVNRLSETDKGRMAVYPQHQLLSQLKSEKGNCPLGCFTLTAKQPS